MTPWIQADGNKYLVMNRAGMMHRAFLKKGRNRAIRREARVLCKNEQEPQSKYGYRGGEA